MSFSFLWLLGGPLHDEKELVELCSPKIQKVLPELQMHIAANEEEAFRVISDIDAAYGIIGTDLFAKAKRLRWIQSPQAGPDPSFFHPDLVRSEVVVTNMRGIFSDHIGAHIMALLLGFARGLPTYQNQQQRKEWQGNAPTVFLPESTVTIIGVGAIGRETTKFCSSFGMRVFGVDPRPIEPPNGMAKLVKPEQMERLIGDTDFVIVTVPETPATQGMFDTTFFKQMKRDSYFINVGRGATVVLSDLNESLHKGKIAGAALDVFETEPLPKDHPLWEAPGMVITPHVATNGPYLNERRSEVILKNCVRFANNLPLTNLVDKQNWF